MTLLWMGMELNATEAADLLTHAMVACLSAIGGDSSRAKEWQARIMAMHADPARRHAMCPTCGQSRTGFAEIPANDPTVVVARGIAGRGEVRASATLFEEG